MLESGTDQTTATLAKACGVGRRTIFRDLESLREAGVPLEFDREAGRFSIAKAFFLPPMNFTAQESLALLAIAAEIGRYKQLPFCDAIYTAAMKLECNLPAPLRREVRRMTKSIRFRLDKVAHLSGKAGIYEQLVEAIKKRHAVEIHYESFTEWETIATKLRPYQLLFSRRSWYIIGRSSLHREVRIFNVARILTLKQLDESFTLPKSFDVAEYLGNAWHLIRDGSRDSHIVLRFKPLVAGNIAEVIWHKTQRLRFLDDGSLEFRATVSGLNEIAWWILGYGDQAEVIRPARLRRLIAQRAWNMAAMYNGDGGR